MERCRRRPKDLQEGFVSHEYIRPKTVSLGWSGSIFHKWIERERWEILRERGGTCAKDPTSPVGAARLGS